MEFKDYELHEQILLYLYEFKDTGKKRDLYYLFWKEKGIWRSIIDEKARELDNRRFIKVSFPIRNTDFKRPKTYPESGQPLVDYANAKITSEGIDYVNKEILKGKDIDQFLNITDSIVNFQSDVKGDQSIKSSETKNSINAPQTSMIKKIVIGIIISVGSALILYYIFGITL